MKIQTSRFGDIEVDDTKVIHFPRGILGFDNLRSYVMMDHGDTPIKWLQAVDDPDVAFMLVDPFPFFPEYKPELSPVERSLLEIESPSDLVILAIMTVRRDQDPPVVTLNLQAPLVFNASRMIGFQIVMEKSKFGVREVIQTQPA